MSRVLLQMARAGAAFLDDSPELAAARETYARQHGVILRQFLAPDLLELALEEIDREPLVEQDEGGYGPDLVLPPSRIGSLLYFLANRPEMYDAVRSITGCDPVRGFDGRVARLPAGIGTGYHWHTDAVGGRLVAVSLNLSRGACEGGRLQIRDRRSRAIVCELENPVPGDATLFRIDPDLEHQVTPVQGSEPRTVFTGWYLSDCNFWTMVPRLSLSPPPRSGS